LEDLAKKGLSNMGPVGKVASKLGVGGKLVDGIMPDGGDDDDEDGAEAQADATGSGRRMPVQQAMDVAVPLDTAYNQWTQFEEYPSFMHRVDSASQNDEAHVTFTEKLWGFSRDFEAEIVEQRPNERIVWRSVNGVKHAGVVTFHELAPRLTRIEVTVDFKPEGFFEKIGRGARFSKRAIRADMHRFKAYIEMSEEEDGAWRGFVEDGEVTGYEEQEQEQEQDDQDGEGQPEAEEGEEAEEEEEEEPEAEEEDEPEAEEEDEPEAEEEDEPEAEEEEEPEAEEEPEEEAEAEEEKPRSRQRKAPSTNGGSGQKRARSKSRSKSGNGGAPRKRPSSPRKPRSAKTASR
ncbi:MAG: SRPBCC family protein, partial [Actinomycetota bacterium]|nr:SRPBCC family protein [Actinomycetota bacterium]